VNGEVAGFSGDNDETVGINLKNLGENGFLAIVGVTLEIINGTKEALFFKATHKGSPASFSIDASGDIEEMYRPGMETLP
jgi:hypothetical protein